MNEINAGLQKTVRAAALYLNHIVFFFLAAAVAASLSGVAVSFSAFAVQVLLGGFIGGVTNKIAIVMLFEKRPYLPGSGVLLAKQGEIIESLARTVETHLINTEMMQEEIKKLIEPVNLERTEQILNRIVDEFREDLRSYLKTGKVRQEIMDALRTKLGFLGKFLNVTRIKEYQEMTEAIVSELDARVASLRISKQMLARAIERLGTLEDFLFQPRNELIRRHYHSEKSLAELLFEKIDIKRMVADRLSGYEASRVRDIIEENVRPHLLWLEVFGVILGMIFSAALYMMTRFFRI